MSISEYYDTLKRRAQPRERAFIHRGIKNDLGHYVVDPRPHPTQPNLPLIELYYIPPGKVGEARLAELKFNGWDEYTGAPTLNHVKTAAEKEDELRSKLREEMRAELREEMSSDNADAKSSVKPSPVKRRKASKAKK